MNPHLRVPDRPSFSGIKAEDKKARSNSCPASKLCIISSRRYLSPLSVSPMKPYSVSAVRQAILLSLSTAALAMLLGPHSFLVVTPWEIFAHGHGTESHVGC